MGAPAPGSALPHRCLGQPGAKFQFPGPVQGPFWPSINGSRPITQRSKEIFLFAGLIIGYPTLAAVAAAAIRAKTEAAEGKEVESLQR